MTDWTQHRLISIAATLAGLALLQACASDKDSCSDRQQIYSGSIAIGGGDGSARLEALECVQVITGDLSISDPSVQSLEPLSSLKQVLGNVSIQSLSKLMSLRGLGQLAEVGGDVLLTDLPVLTSLDGLNQLSEIGGNLELSRLAKLSSVEGLARLRTVEGSIRLTHLDLLATLRGMSELSSIGGSLEVTNNGSLADLAGFDGLRAIEGDFSLLYNPALTSVFVTDPAVGGTISITNNDGLIALRQFGVPRMRTSCSSPWVQDFIRVMSNQSLSELVLPPVTFMDITVLDNPQLTSVSAPLDTYGSQICEMWLGVLPRLSSVTLHNWGIGDLLIDRTGLTTLDGFDIVPVRCGFKVTGNPALTDISAFSPGGMMAAEFKVTDNPTLPTCQVQAMANALPSETTQCLVGDGLTTGTRLVDIQGNNDAAVCQ